MRSWSMFGLSGTRGNAAPGPDPGERMRRLEQPLSACAAFMVSRIVRWLSRFIKQSAPSWSMMHSARQSETLFDGGAREDLVDTRRLPDARASPWSRWRDCARGVPAAHGPSGSPDLQRRAVGPHGTPSVNG